MHGFKMIKFTDEIEKKYCKRCTLNANIPGVAISEEGICNICSYQDTKDYMNRYKLAVRNYKKFRIECDSRTDKNSNYDCVFMLSGGKDSTYLLYKFITEFKIRPLVVTIKNPFFADKSLENVYRVTTGMDIDHVFYSPNAGVYKKIMTDVFLNQKASEKLGVKTPCTICSNIEVLCAYIYAYRLNIPYIVYASDPLQVGNCQKNIKEVIEPVYEFVDHILLDQLFPREIIENTLRADDSDVPKMIYPYSDFKEYNREKIVEELKELGLYASSSRETHCILYTLLSYYTYKKFDTCFYGLETAVDVRNGLFQREETIDILESYKKVCMELAIKENIDEVDKKFIEESLKKVYKSEDMQSQFECEVENVLKLKEVAEFLNLNLEDIK